METRMDLGIPDSFPKFLKFLTIPDILERVDILCYTQREV